MILLFYVPGLYLFAQPQSIIPPTSEHNDYFYEDDKGFYWISSLKGWYRTNGLNFRLVGIQENDPEGYDRYVQSRLFPDGEGGLWYTGYNGLHRIDENTEALTSYRLEAAADSIIVGYRAFYMDNQNKELWLRVGEEVMVFELETRAYRKTGLITNDYQYDVRSFPDGTPSLIVASPWIDGPGFQVMRRATLQSPWSANKIYFPEVNDDHYVSSLVSIKNDLLILGTSNGIAVYDLKGNELSRKNDDKIQGAPEGVIIDVAFDTVYETLYVSEKDTGIWRFPVRKDGSIDWGLGKLDQTIKTPNLINKTEAGEIWTSTPKSGLQRSFVHKDLFKLLTPARNVTDLLVGPNQNAFALSSVGKLYQFVDNDVSLIPPAGRRGDYNSLVFSRHHWWAKTQKSIWKIPINASGETEEFPLPEMARINMAVHESGDVLVSGTRGVFLKKANGSNNFIRPPEFSAIDDWEVNFLNYCRGGPLVLDYNSIELRAFDWRADSFDLRYSIPLSAGLRSFAKGGNPDSGWAGTYEGLLRITDGKAEKVALSTRDGANLDIRTIVPLADTLLLLGTEKGLLVHHLNTGKTQTYTEDDGLPSIDFRPGAGGIDREGRCWMLAGGRVFSFDPAELLAYRPPLPRPYLGGVWVNDIPLEDVPFTGREAPLEFPYWKNDLRFSVNNLGFDRPEKTRVSLRLLGRDSVWQTTEPGTPVAYSNLPPGEYWLEMESISKNGFLRRGEPVRLTITAAWYDRWYVRVGIVLGLIGVGVGLNWLIVRNRIVKLEREHRRRQAVSEERMRIARRLHDDLGGDLTSVVSVISTQRYLRELGGEVEPLDLAALEEQVKEANTNMREIVWAIDDKKATFHHLAEELTKLVKSHPARSWKPVVEFPKVPPELTFSPEQKLNVYLIFKEGVQNIVKHAPKASLCLLRVRTENGPAPALVIELADDGPGPFAKKNNDEQKEISGFGLENMRHRAAAIGGELLLTERSPHGTLLRLRLPLGGQI